MTLEKNEDVTESLRPAEAPKGRPTPKRSEAQAARRGRAYVPKDRKEQARSNRDAARTARERQMLALRGQGNERDLPARDQGPVRRFARDFVDSRWTAFEFFLPILLVILVLSVIPSLARISVLLWPLSMVIIILQTTWLGLVLRKQLRERFPNQNTKGAIGYAIMRSMQMRRLRLPKPVVKRGQKP
ncbi:DUF3043 domain-containing protein [Streptacidiphilus monticola]